MPKLDTTGPQGEGSKTGRGLGNCSNPEIKNNKFMPKIPSTRGFGLGKGAVIRKATGNRRGNR